MAALASRGVEESDPRMVAARAALSFHRLKRTIDAEVAGGHMSPWFAEVLTEKLATEAAL